MKSRTRVTQNKDTSSLILETESLSSVLRKQEGQSSNNPYQHSYVAEGGVRSGN